VFRWLNLGKNIQKPLDVNKWCELRNFSKEIHRGFLCGGTLDALFKAVNTFGPGHDQRYASSYSSGLPFGTLMRDPSGSKIRTGTSLPAQRPNGRLIARRIAKAMLGRAVTIRLESGGTLHGIVTEVLADRRKDKVVVAGSHYDLAQVLTASPPEITSQAFACSLP
jgi:hypothetical protein